jgi:hypothetical protein
MALWVKLLALSASKKLMVIAIAKTYGIPRLYRKMVKTNNYLFKDYPQTKIYCKKAIDFSVRWPNIVKDKWKNFSK